MRIAMLAPITRRIPPRPYRPEEQMISDLTECLLERGHQVVLFAAGNSLTRAELVATCPRPLVESEDDPWPDPRWWEEAHISECMGLAAGGKFDIVHNHMHVKALVFAMDLKIPVLTNLHGAARDKQLHSLLLRFKDYPFVAMDKEERDLLPGLNYTAEIPLPSAKECKQIDPMVDQYEALYQDLVSAKIPSPTSELRRITPWGTWEVLEDDPLFKVKRIRINPGQRLSYQRHQKRREHWVVVMGKAQVVLDGKTIDLEPGQAVDIPEKAAHRMGNPTDESMVFIEVQRGEYFGEDDIERLDDDYGRN